MTEAFFRRAKELRIDLDQRLFWYHTIDLGNGLVTPGTFDYRTTLPDFGFPTNMQGMSAIDIGSATGFFAFDLERRGAQVTSIEVSSLSQWDHFPGESELAIITKMRDIHQFHSLLPKEQIAATFRDLSAQQLYQILLDDPFWFCHRILNSKVTRAYSTIYDLPVKLAPTKPFDLVLIGDILLHTIDPLHALASASKICGETLVIVQEMAPSENERPAMYYVGGTTPDSDEVQWWHPNFPWLKQILKRLGFARIELAGHVRGHIRPGGEPFEKHVIHAHRSAR